jgi:hypothetical protein
VEETMHRQRVARFVLTIGLMVSPAIAWAQTSAGIAGVARDTTGAVLPGVSVEASSPALIEKARTAVTDGEGRYNIVDLRPGTYSVTFTLQGFSALRREGIELTTGFTATVNAEMMVGAVGETITVTGATPVVDVTNVSTQQVLRTETMNQLPSGAKNLMAYASLTSAATRASRPPASSCTAAAATTGGRTGTA